MYIYIYIYTHIYLFIFIYRRVINHPAIGYLETPKMALCWNPTAMMGPGGRRRRSGNCKRPRDWDWMLRARIVPRRHE